MSTFIKSDQDFERFFKEFYPAVYAFMQHYTGDDELSADLTQDVFLKVYEQREKIVSLESAKAFLYTVGRYLYWNHCKHERARERYIEQLQENEEDDYDFLPEGVYAKEEDFREMEKPNLQVFYVMETGYRRMVRWDNLLRFRLIGGPSRGEEVGNEINVRGMYFGQLHGLVSERYPALGYVLDRVESLYGPVRSLGGSDLSIGEVMESEEALERWSLAEMWEEGNLDARKRRVYLERKMEDLVDRVTWAGVQPTELAGFLGDFWREHAFEQVEYEVFRREVEAVFGVDVEDVLREWYDFKGLPEFWVKDVRKDLLSGWRVGEPVRWGLKATVFNAGEVEGFVRVKIENIEDTARFRRGVRGGWNPYNEEYVVCRLKPGAGQRVDMEVGWIGKVELSMAHARNLPNMLEFRDTTDRWRVYPEGEVTREEFVMGDVVVDDVDEGCRLVRRVPLFERLRYGEEGRPLDWRIYGGFFLPAGWTKIVGEGFYGLSRKSCIERLAGNGNSGVEWTAELPEAGEYEVFVYLGDVPADNGDVLTYTVGYDGGEEMVEVDMKQRGWVSIGRYACTAGNNRVYLTDKGRDKQWIYADAVKWMRVRD